MVQSLPERWNLPAQITIITQFANIGILLYVIVKKKFGDSIQEYHVIIVIISIGMVSCFLLGFFWDVTSEIGEQERSLVLYILTFSLAFVDCVSCVVYIPYMATFRSEYLVSMFVGEGMGGLITAMLGLIQGVGGEPECVNNTIINSTGEQLREFQAVYPSPRFSVNVFYFILFTILCTTFVAFLTLHFYPGFSAERNFKSLNHHQSNLNHQSNQHNTSHQNEVSHMDVFTVQAVAHSTHENQNVIRSFQCSCPSSQTVNRSVLQDVGALNNLQLNTRNQLNNQSGSDPMRHDYSSNSTCKHSSSHKEDRSIDERIMTSSSLYSSVLLGVTIAWIGFLQYGLLISLQSYSCLPYGTLTYNLAVCLSNVANPLTCFTGLVFKVKSMKIILIMVIGGSLCAAYHVLLACLSPTPPLIYNNAGPFLAVTSYVLFTALFSYARLLCTSLLSDLKDKKGLFLSGLVMQIGCLLGALLAFLLTTVFKLFHSLDPCVI